MIPPLGSGQASYNLKASRNIPLRNLGELKDGATKFQRTLMLAFKNDENYYAGEAQAMPIHAAKAPHGAINGSSSSENSSESSPVSQPESLTMLTMLVLLGPRVEVIAAAL